MKVGGDAMIIDDQSPSWARATDSLANNTKDILLLLCRVGLAYLYVISLQGKLPNPEAFGGYLTKIGMPGGMATAYLSIEIEIVGAIAILVGLGTRYAILVLTLFVIIASFYGHRYWEADAAQLRNQTVHFYKNVSIVAGYLLLFITGPGRYSLDHMLGKKT